MNNSMVSTKEIAMAIQKVAKERQLSYETINEMTEKKNEEDPSFPVVSISTLSRLLRKGGENGKYSYEDTLRPLATLLLDVETFDSNDKSSAEALMSILHFKKEIISENTRRIESLESELASVRELSKEQVDKEKTKYHNKLEKETDRFQKSLDFAMKQIELKDKRIDQLLDANAQLLNQLLSCPYHKNCKGENA